MANIYYKRLLGGGSNGLLAPPDWDIESVQEAYVDGQDPQRYSTRVYIQDGDTFHVWVWSGVPEDAFFGVMRWHRLTFNQDILAINKEILRDVMGAAKEYSNIIMLAGYAALFALLTQVDAFHIVTKLIVAILIAISVGCFVAIELVGMLMRQRAVLTLARAIGEPATQEARMNEFGERTGQLARRMIPYQVGTQWLAIATGVGALFIMGAALLHGLWIEFLRASIKAAGVG